VFVLDALVDLKLGVGFEVFPQGNRTKL